MNPGPAPAPAGLAADAAEAVRALNHATLPAAGGLVFPADAYEVSGSLALLASRLPQALAQLLAFLQSEAAAGRVVIVAADYIEPTAPVDVILASPHLARARTLAQELLEELARFGHDRGTP